MDAPKKESNTEQNPETISASLNAKQERAWHRLAPHEREWMGVNLTAYSSNFKISLRFCEMPDTKFRLLYALTVTGVGFTIPEISYLLIKRWQHNTDVFVIRSRIAVMVLEDEMFSINDERYTIAPAGVERLQKFSQSQSRKKRRSRTSKRHFTEFRNTQ